MSVGQVQIYQTLKSFLKSKHSHFSTSSDCILKMAKRGHTDHSFVGSVNIFSVVCLFVLLSGIWKVHIWTKRVE